MTRTTNLERRLFPRSSTNSSATFSKFRSDAKPKAFDELLLEMPQQLDLMGAMLVNGENIYSAFAWIVQRTSGTFTKGIARLIRRVDLGESLERALELLAIEVPSPLVGEFSNKLTLCLERGTPLADQLNNLSESARAQLRVQLLRQAGKNEIKMLIPLVFVILPVTVLVAVYPSFQLLQINF